MLITVNYLFTTNKISTESKGLVHYILASSCLPDFSLESSSGHDSCLTTVYFSLGLLPFSIHPPDTLTLPDPPVHLSPITLASQAIHTFLLILNLFPPPTFYYTSGLGDSELPCFPTSVSCSWAPQPPDCPALRLVCHQTVLLKLPAPLHIHTPVPSFLIIPPISSLNRLFPPAPCQIVCLCFPYVTATCL